MVGALLVLIMHFRHQIQFLIDVAYFALIEAVISPAQLIKVLVEGFSKSLAISK